MNKLIGVILFFVPILNSHAAFPSRAAVYSCLSAGPVTSSVKWEGFVETDIYEQDDYLDGFNATYYIIHEGTEIGYAEKGDVKAILYAHTLYPIGQARQIPGFSVRPTELNPYSAGWGTVQYGSGKFLCISFPFGNLGQSGSFQENRSAYMLPLGSTSLKHDLYSAAGNIDMFKRGYRKSISR